MSSADWLVSAIMPAYNSSAYIAEAIRSVLDQDYNNLELIVVDDGSSDDTTALARSFGERVTVIQQSNKGPAAARNRGAQEARGELLAFIDSDDVWSPGKVRAQVDYLQAHPDVGVVYGRLIRWLEKEDGTFDPPPAPGSPPTERPVAPDRSGWIYPELLLDSVIWVVTAMVRRPIWEALGGMDESLRCGEDYDFFIRASRICRMHELDEVLAAYRIHRQSACQIVRSDDPEYAVMVTAIDQFGTAGPDGREVSSKLLRKRLFQLAFSQGYRHYWRGNPRIAAESFRQALIRGRKASPRAFAYYLLSLAKSLRTAEK